MAKKRFRTMIKEVLAFNRAHGIEYSWDYESLSYLGLALSGEVGEAVNVLKKILRDGDSPEKRKKLAEEIVDICIYLALILDLLQVDFDEAWLEKFRVLAERWEGRTMNGSFYAKEWQR